MSIRIGALHVVGMNSCARVLVQNRRSCDQWPAPRLFCSGWVVCGGMTRRGPTATPVCRAPCLGVLGAGESRRLAQTTHTATAAASRVGGRILPECKSPPHEAKCGPRVSGCPAVRQKVKRHICHRLEQSLLWSFVQNRSLHPPERCATKKLLETKLKSI